MQAITITFRTQLFTVGGWTILRLPEAASATLPSRGQTMIKGTINGYNFETPLEPDGRWSHWFKIDEVMSQAIKARAGDTVTVSIAPSKDWPEPPIPADIKKALHADSKAHELWTRITPMARWEWIRWIRGTSRQETRVHRIKVACSKLRAGERRPCCWNRNLCSEPTVSKNGQLQLPA